MTSVVPVPIMPLPDRGSAGSGGWGSNPSRRQSRGQTGGADRFACRGGPGACAWFAVGDVVPGVVLALLRTQGVSIHAHGH